MTNRTRAVLATLCLTTVGLAACGQGRDPADRGYTKDPLEVPGVIPQEEPASEMDALGDPAIVPHDRPQLPPASTAPAGQEPAAAGAASAPGAQTSEAQAPAATDTQSNPS